jgi:hypothetical protein
MKSLHKHHIIPKYAGGDNSKENMSPPISTELHAEIHRLYYEEFGKTEDFIAWKSLLGQSFKGIIFTPEVRKKMSQSGKGRIFSEEHRKNLSKANKGKTRSEETKKKLSESHKGNIPWNKGIPQTEETKKKLSDALKGRKYTKRNL